MKKLIKALSSFYLMGAVLLGFAISIGLATFIEKWYGTATARAEIYNSWWFELLLFIGIINISGIIIIQKLYRKEKFTLFMFHLSFIIILSGAAITRYFGYEGVMHIREGETSNRILSVNSFLYASATTGKDTLYDEKSFIVSALDENHHKLHFSGGNKNISLECTEFIPNATEVVKESPNGKPIIELVIAGHAGREIIPLVSGQSRKFGTFTISFNDTTNQTGVNISMTDTGSLIKAPFDIVSMNMATQKQDTLPKDTYHPFIMMSLYILKTVKLVANNYYPSGEIDVITNPHAAKNQLPTALRLKLTVDNKTKSLLYFASENSLNKAMDVTFEGISFKISYGSKPILLPFSLKLDKFKMERYPGSKSPSSYESYVTLIDPAKNIKEDRQIYMNNVLSHRGYRFYQSSYDEDEKGTILSVNHDYWGTIVTYLGYFLMSLAMALSLFNKNSRFIKLSKELTELKNKKKALIAGTIILFLFFPGISVVSAQPPVPDSLIINAQQASKFGELLIQDPGGRIKPINSLSSEVLRKISRKTSWKGLNSDQVILSMICFPQYWQSVPMIKFSHPEIGRVLNVEGKFAAFNNLFDQSHKSRYILAEYVNEAYKKEPRYRNKFDNEVIRFDERANLCYYIYTGEFFKLFPKEGDKNKTWYNPETVHAAFQGDELNYVSNVFSYYIESLIDATKNGKWENADTLVGSIHSYQQKFGGDIIPSRFKVNLEIIYNRANIFDRLSSLFGLIGFILLMLQFIALFRPKMNLKKVMNVAKAIILAGFALHLAGLAVRWYISGHAPWSNGYESMIFIAFATILAGIIFSKKSEISLSATALLAWIILHTAHYSWMDPEITNLVPVLKSYWLNLHVSIITASYGFFALGAILAFLNLVIMYMQTEKNFDLFGITISQLTAVIEMTLIAGLYLLSIGTFLGGVWANESWGRYWGWDAKETWALVTILVYAFVSHMRFIPGFKSKYLFNVMALVSFGTVLMTYFGVNYYLSGLHSYAKGDAAPVPPFVYYTIAVITTVAVMAYVNQKVLLKKKA